jgi:hypothetical protein
MDGVLYCKPHFEQLFKESGNFSKNFHARKIFFFFFVSFLSFRPLYFDTFTKIINEFCIWVANGKL